MVEEVADKVRRQLLAVGVRQGLAPVLDVARDPRWGRVEETYGEDPVLAGALGTAYVRGMQTDDLTEGVLATGKHFVAHGLSWRVAAIARRCKLARGSCEKFMPNRSRPP